LTGWRTTILRKSIAADRVLMIELLYSRQPARRKLGSPLL
jgi:hypothetical protein